MKSEVTRRLFLNQAALSMLGFATAARPLSRVRNDRLSDDAGLTVRNQLLDMVNRERRDAGLRILKLDELACRVAEAHAIDMAQSGFLSHWGTDGRKPYQRYSFAGGIDAIEENDGASDHGAPVASDEAAGDLISLHSSMFYESPPDDGHRKTILNWYHTHVGFGMATRGTRVRLCELYIAKYMTIDPYRPKARVGSKFTLSGHILDQSHSVKSIDVFYEPLPVAPDLLWLRELRAYGLPDNRERLMPKLPENTFYEDGSSGSIEMFGPKFRVRISLSKTLPGIYTIVVWLQQYGTSFPATQICVRAE
ncbi:MAG TPA: CAP domain-containing protein [Pyrinomonadaceae bacterium]